VALHWLERACEIEQAVGDREGLLSTQQCRAATFLELGKLSEARAVLDQVLAENADSSDTWTMGSCLCTLAEVQLLQGEVETARSTAQRVLAMPGIADNARIHAWAQSGLALVQLVAGETGAAQATLADAPADDLGFELSSRWQLVQSALARASGDLAGAQALAQTVAQEATQGLSIMLPAERMATASTLPLAEMVRMILIGVIDH
jgi:ATP/maltotriose-dependent transcriptional regulator MalT